MLDVELFGMDPGFHHLTNIWLHAFNAVLVLLLLRGLLARGTTPRFEPGVVDITALFAAAAFALHPLRLESVVWISERKDLLSACLGLMTLLAYLRYAERPGWARYVAVPLLLALGLAAKPMLVSLPLLMLLLISGRSPLWHRRTGGGLPPPARVAGREAAAPCARGGIRLGHAGGPELARRGRRLRDAAVRRARRQRRGGLRRLPRRSRLAAGTLGLLSAPARGLAVVAGGGRCSRLRRHRHVRRARGPSPAVVLGGLGLVRDPAAAGDRSGTGRNAISRRSIHLPPAPGADADRVRAVRVLVDAAARPAAAVGARGDSRHRIAGDRHVVPASILAGHHDAVRTSARRHTAELPGPPRSVERISPGRRSAEGDSPRARGGRPAPVLLARAKSTRLLSRSRGADRRGAAPPP